jgi:hypothetical protein|tara:strand:- start:347 stop:571 length:225 start_codon:yes stop_codon:yes gene_type:complete
MKNSKDWIKEMNELDKKQESIEKLMNKETDSLILEGLAMLHGHIVDELFEAMHECEYAIRHEESYEPGAGEDWL